MVVDTAYYEALNVSEDASQDEIRKAYRRMAVKTHPDKNPGDEEAKAKFQAVGEAYQVLNDPKLRERYDKLGKEAAIPDAGFEDPMELVVQIFGGEAFKPWIGELSMFKEMMEMSKGDDEEPESAGNPANEGTPTETSPENKDEPQTNTSAATAPLNGADSKPSGSNTDSSTNRSKGPVPAATGSSETPADPEVPASSTPIAGRLEYGTATDTKPLTKEEIAAQEREARQLRKEKQRRLAEASRESRQQRIDELTQHLENKLASVIEQWSPKFMSSGKANSHDEALLSSFVEQCQLEANSLKMESFGLELLHTIGQVYYTRANIYIKSHKSILGMGGLFSSVKERGSIIKDGWNTLTAAMDAANTIKTMSELEDEALSPEEIAARDQGIMGNVLVALWSGTRFELQGILRQVADNLLYDQKVDSKIRIARARAMLELGRTFKQTVRTKQEAEEVQMFESLVADAMVDKKKKKSKK